MFKRILASIGGVVATLAFVSISFAATSVRLEQPKSPTNQNSFNLVFVALDTQDNPVTVKCFKKGPSDAGFSQFGADITLSNGGNTDNCPVTSSVMNTNGTYSFYVEANGVISSTVTVDFNTSGPGTPSNYSKDHPTSCQYKISFKTADDGGKTVKVELYRSVNTSFNADSGTRVQTMGIGSNSNGTFTDNIPDCNATYYYAIRAFDSASNGSGLVGDSQTVTTVINPTEAPTTAGSASVLAKSTQQTGGAIPVTTSGVTPGAGENPTGTVSTTPGEKEVLGSTKTPSEAPTSVGEFVRNNKSWLLLLGALIALAAAVWFFKTRNNS